MQSAAAAAAAPAGFTGAIHPVTAATMRILGEMEATLTCPACHKLLDDPQSLPCQHHHCRACIEEYLELNSVCRQCGCKFWARDLVPNQSIAALIEHYNAMRVWLEQKKAGMDASSAGHKGSGAGPAHDEHGERKGGRSHHHKDHHDDDAGGGAGGSAERSEEKENRPAPSTRRGAQPSTKSAATGAAHHTPRRSHGASPQVDMAAAASSSVAAAAPSSSSSSHVTPPRMSLKDAIAAAASSSSAKSAAPPSSLSALPRPGGALSPAAAQVAPSSTTSAAPTAAGGGGGSHSKQFSKQGFAKTATSPVPTTTAASSTSVLAPAAATCPSPSAKTTARNTTMTQLFGENAGDDSDSDIEEVQPMHRRAGMTNKAPVNGRLHAPAASTMAVTAAAVAPQLQQHRKPAVATAQQPAKQSGTLDSFLRAAAVPAAAVVKTTLTSKVLSLPEASPSLASSPFLAPPAAVAAVPPSQSSMDSDGDALMLAADVTRLVQGLGQQEIPTQFQNLSALSQPNVAAVEMPVMVAASNQPPVAPAAAPTSTAAVAPVAPAAAAASTSSGEKSPHIPPSATASSLSPTLVHSPPPLAHARSGGSHGSSHSGGSRNGSERPLSSSPPPALPKTGSLSLPASYPIRQLTDVLSSPPPLEAAPLIDIYSPQQHRRDGADADDAQSQSQAEAAVQLSQQHPHQQPEQMEIDAPAPPPVRRSLAGEVAALQEADEAEEDGAPAEPEAAAAGDVAMDQTQAGVAATSAAPSQADAVSVHLSLFTQGSAANPVAMPSMHHAAPVSPSQPRTAIQSAHASPTRVAETAPVAPVTPGKEVLSQGAVSVVTAASPVSTSAATLVQTQQTAAAVSAPPSPAAPVASAAAAAAAIHPAQPTAVQPAAAAPVAAPAAYAADAPAAADPLHAATLPLPAADSPTITVPVQPELPPNQSLVHSRPLVVCPTSLTKDQMASLRAFCSRTHTTLHSSKRWSPTITHVIANAHPSNRRSSLSGAPLASRSLKYMQGLLSGAWVVEWGWVAASIERGHWAPESSFEIGGDVSSPLVEGPRLSREREGRGEARLLKGVKICAHPQMGTNDPAVEDLRSLVTLGEGVWIPTPAALMHDGPAADAQSGALAAAAAPVSSSSSLLSSSGVTRAVAPTGPLPPGPVYLLVRSQEHADHAAMAHLGAAVGMLPLRVTWLLNSISKCALQPVDLYRADLSQEEKAEIKQAESRLAQAQAQVPVSNANDPAPPLVQPSAAAAGIVAPASS